MNFVELRDTLADHALLRRFYDGIYTGEFPDADERESYDNMIAYLSKVGTHANGYHIVIAMEADDIVGGSISDYFADSNTGVVEFIVMAPDRRQQGSGSLLLRQTESLLIADAIRAGRSLSCVMAEINDPFRQNEAHDTVDPFSRATWWSRRGYGRLDFPYIQPSLSPEQRQVSHLMLCAKRIGQADERAVPAAAVDAFLRDYLIFAMRITDPSSSAEYLGMEHWLQSRDLVAICDLAAYVGEDPSLPLDIYEVCGPDDPKLDDVLRVYEASFHNPLTRISAAEFRGALVSRTQTSAYAYHLFALEDPATRAVAGMVSFFTLPTAGFGGYIAMGAPLRGTGRLQTVLARVERQMLADSSTVRGWYIECEEQRVASIFAAHGFFEVDATYQQPALALDGDRQAQTPPLRLMYKEFGTRYAPPNLHVSEFLRAIRDVFEYVYGVEDPDAHPAFASVAAASRHWKDVPFATRPR